MTINITKTHTPLNKQIDHVLLVALSKGYGGADVRVFDLAKTLHGEVPYTVMALKDSLLSQKLTAAGLSVYSLDYSRSDPRIMWQIRKFIQVNKVNVVDAHNPQSQLWGLWAAKTTAVPSLISTVHHAYGQVDNLRQLDRMYERVLLANIRWGCQFVTVSQTIYDYLIKIGVTQENVTLSHNAIDLDGTASEPPDYSWREKLGWGDETTVVIVVGRLESVKGHNYLLEAMQLAVQQQPQLRCVIVGEGRTRPALEQQIQDLALDGVVHLAGFQGNVAALLGSSDIFCLSSLSEGLPYALLEAAAYQLPFVVTAVGGMAELLTDQQDALLVPPMNPSALAEALCQLAGNPLERARLGQASHDLVRQRFAPDVMKAETLAVYSRNL